MRGRDTSWVTLSVLKPLVGLLLCTLASGCKSFLDQAELIRSSGDRLIVPILSSIDPIDEGARLRSKPHHQVMADGELAGQRRCMPAAVRDLRGRRHRQLATTSRLGKSQHSAPLRPRDCRSRTAHVDLP